MVFFSGVFKHITNVVISRHDTCTQNNPEIWKNMQKIIMKGTLLQHFCEYDVKDHIFS